MERSVVVISRRWSGPLIKVDVRTVMPGDGSPDTEITVQMSLAEFVQTLSQEVGNPAFLLTEAGLRKALIEAADRVIEGMKAETTRAM